MTLARVPVVPMLRSPGKSDRPPTDHQVRPHGDSPTGRPWCGLRMDSSTWTVIPAHAAVNRCGICDKATA